MKLEPRREIEPEHFRRVMGQFASGVAVVTAVVGGQPRGMTANAFMSGSLAPPLCIVSIAKRAQMHAHLTAAERFAVNILAAGQEDVATHFAGRRVAGLKIAFRDAAGIPAVTGTSALITAETMTSHDCGDHTLFIGHILTMEAGDRPPLLFHAGRFAALVPLREAAPNLPEFW